MPHIKKLPTALVNKIAAGEVIERPASVVKELTENAIDARATRIDVAIEDGGARLIRVTDNGRGISRQDLPLAIAPHATSKIYTTDDLFHIQSLGFRGEALASIASISHLRIASRPADQIEGHELTTNQDETDDAEPKLAPCAAPPGTTIEVRNLFFNVPARRKFLRRPQTECSHVTEQIARLSLAHPEIAFTLTHNGRSLRNLPTTTDRRERIADFYGAELAHCLLDIKRDERGLSIEAFIAPPAQSRASSKWQYLFLNGRYIADRRIGYAIREAFRGLVEHDRYPVAFVFLTADPAEFDVNVHPTKIEVRWRDAGLVQSQVLAVLRETLLSCDLTPRLRPPTRAGDPAAQQRARHALADYLKRVDPTQPRLQFQPPPFPTDRLRHSIANTLPAQPDTPSTQTPTHPTLGPQSPSREPQPPHDQPEALARTDTNTLPENPQPSPSNQPSPNPLASSRPPLGQDPAHGDPTHTDAPTPANTVMQIHNTYLVAQTAEGVIIIDQHALHERILYERFRERILQGPLESQGLLIPETIDASPAQIQAADQHATLLKQIGIDLSAFGPNALAVQSFPALLHKVDIRTFVAHLLDRLTQTGGGESEETLIHAALDMMACKAAVKAGDPLTTDEIYALLEQRHLTQRASNCPHGRPTTLELTTHDLEKQFRRV